MFNLELLKNNLTEILKKNCGSVKNGLLECDVDKNMIDSIKRRNSVPSIESVYKVADHFDVSIDYLLGREKAPATQGLSEDERQLLTSFRGASPEGQRSILRVAKNECRGLDIDESHARIEEMLSGHNQDFQEEDA